MLIFGALNALKHELLHVDRFERMRVLQVGLIEPFMEFFVLFFGQNVVASILGERGAFTAR